MEYEQAVALSAAIGNWLNGSNPVLSVRDDSEQAAMAAFLQALRDQGLMERMDKDYLERLCSGFRVLDGRSFMEDPFLRRVQFEQNVNAGRFLLAHVDYQRGELLQYRMPDYAGAYPVLSVGCFSSPVRTVALYENGMPWMTVCPSEITSMQNEMRHAHGRVLTLGLGLGYYALAAARKPEVSCVTAVEKEKDVISLFQAHIRPWFPEAEKIQIVEADALDYCARLRDGQFDYCFADLWIGQEDGLPLYLRLKELLSPLRQMETEYWIEKEIRAYLLYRYASD